MNDKFAGASFFKRFLGSGPHLTDDIDRLSAFGKQSGDMVVIGAHAPDEAGGYSQHLIRYFTQRASPLSEDHVASMATTPDIWTRSRSGL